MDNTSLSSPEDKLGDDLKNYDRDLVIDINYPVPFLVDETTSIEYEIKSCLKQCVELVRSYLYRIAIITIVLIGVLYFQGLLMFLSDTYYMSTNRVPLLDRVHQIMDKYNHPFTPTMCHIFMFGFVFTGIFRIILFTPLYYFLEMTLRYVFLFGSAYFIRGLFVYMTTIPSCHYNCNPDLKRRAFFPFLIRIIAGYMGLATNCSDLIISGHTMFTTITCVLFIQNVKYLITKILIIAVTGFTLFLIIACKYHYSVDVMFGLIISLLIYYFYLTKLDAYGVEIVNKIYHSKDPEFQNMNRPVIFNTFLARFFVKMELLEERLILGQKMRTLYLLVNNKENVIDRKLLNKFNHFAHLFGSDESDDLLTLYRGTRNLNLYYWKQLYCKIFKRKQNVALL